MGLTQADRRVADAPRVARIVACCAVLGTLVHLLSGVLHGSLTAGTGQSSSATVFAHVLRTPAWPAANMLALLATVAWLAVFVALQDRWRPPGAGSWLARLATVTLAIGIATSALLYLTDAVVLPELARQWADADGVEQARLVAVGDAVQVVLRTPLFNTLPLFVFGLPFALLGLAHLHRPSVLPAWLAWLVTVVGTVSFLAGLSWTLGATLIPELLLWAVLQPLLWVWGVVTGIVLWRNAAAGVPGEQRQ